MDALLILAQSGATRHPQLSRIIQAQRINRMMGGFAVFPWEIDEITDEWLMAFDGLELEYPKLRKSQEDWEQRLERFRSEHPTYKKYEH